VIKRFTAESSRAALALVRESLGPDAVILSNRRVGEQVELLVATDLSAVMEPAPADQTGSAEAAATPPRQPAQTPPEELARLESELVRLRGMVERELQQRSWRDVALGPTVEVVLQQRLLQLGISRVLGGALLDVGEADGTLETRWQHLLSLLARRVRRPAAPAVLPAQKLLACVGSTGVGKTVTTARLALRDQQRSAGGRVGLIAFDCHRPVQAGPLPEIAQQAGLEYREAGSVAEMRLALRQLSHCRRVYIDTAGYGQRDPRWQEQLELLIGIDHGIALCCVLSAAAQPAQIREMLQLLKGKPLLGAVVTKVDEAVVLGGVLDAMVRAGIQLLGFSRSGDASAELEAAAPAELVALAEAQRLRQVEPGMRSPAVPSLAYA
tara:strand:+ start:341237 stop:342382 length:1146 start_codon:yes stop_codon:yes gene_type:complete